MNNSEIMYHIGLSKEMIEGAQIAILPGDPGRVGKIAKYFTNSKKINVNREYTSYLATLKNEKILIISTGMGGPSTAICVEELAQIGIKKLIRVGTCGGMQLDVMPGDLIIAQGAIRQEGTSKEYVPIEYPALGDIDLINALKKACKKLGYKEHTGIVHCKDSFYGQHSPERMPVGFELQNKWEAWIKSGALASEMETASLYTVSSVLGLKAAAVLTVIWNQERARAGLDQDTNLDVDKEVKATIEAIKEIIKM